MGTVAPSFTYLAGWGIHVHRNPELCKFHINFDLCSASYSTHRITPLSARFSFRRNISQSFLDLTRP